MSAFLGPIHYCLYNKISIEDRLVDDILKLNEVKGFVPGLAEEADRECGVIEKRPLEDIIDTGNIHGWLQERVTIVEDRLAYVVTAIVKDDASRMEDILAVAYETGKEVAAENAVEDMKTAPDVFQLINNIVLDGMPCDRINEMVSSSEDEVVYCQTRCIHESHWLRFGGLVMNYYDIRRELLKGVLETTPFTLTVAETGESVIRRK